MTKVVVIDINHVKVYKILSIFGLPVHEQIINILFNEKNYWKM